MANVSSSFRFSCDACYASKLRCSREKPQCDRCKRSQLDCIYSPGKRPGRRKKVAPLPSLDNNSTTASDVSSRTTSQPHDDIDLNLFMQVDSPPDTSSSLAIVDIDEPHQIITNDDFNNTLFDPCGEHVTKSLEQMTAAAPSPWMHPFLADEPQDATFMDQVSTLYTNSCSSQGSLMGPVGTVDMSTQSHQRPWSADREDFWRDCDTLSDWSSSSLSSLTALKDPIQSNRTDDRCACVKGLISLQLHAERHSLSESVSVDATLYIQRLWLWLFQAHRDCHGCRHREWIAFSLSSIAGRLIKAYRTILEEYGHGRRAQPNGRRTPEKSRMHTMPSVKIGFATVEDEAKASFIYSKFIQCLANVASTNYGYQASWRSSCSRRAGHSASYLATNLPMLMQDLMKRFNC